MIEMEYNYIYTAYSVIEIEQKYLAVCINETETVYSQGAEMEQKQLIQGVKNGIETAAVCRMEQKQLIECKNNGIETATVC